MVYIAAVKDTYTGKVEIIERDSYTSKKAFATDLRGNGYKVRFITTEENFDDDCIKYHEKIERKMMINKCRRQTKRELRAMGIDF